MTDEAPKIFSPDYYTRMGANEAGSWWNAAMRENAARLLRRAGLPERGVALDVGCGTGQTMSWVRAMRPAWRCIGVDVAPEGLQLARARGEDVMRASALDLPVERASVDLVVTLDVVQHLPHPAGDIAAFAEMRRILRPGGLLLLRTNAQGFPRTVDDPEAMFRKYDAPSLARKLAASGFETVRLSRVNALLGLAEIPRELRARRESGTSGYHGLLAVPRRPTRADSLKRWWLELEGRAVAAGLRLPAGRAILALCRAQGS